MKSLAQVFGELLDKFARQTTNVLRSKPGALEGRARQESTGPTPQHWQCWIDQLLAASTSQWTLDNETA